MSVGRDEKKQQRCEWCPEDVSFSMPPIEPLSRSRVQVEGEAVQVLAVEVLSGTPAPPHR